MIKDAGILAQKGPLPIYGKQKGIWCAATIEPSVASFREDRSLADLAYIFRVVLRKAGFQFLFLLVC